MKIMANSVPKSGTHLLFRLLYLLGYKWPNFSVGAHVVEGRFRHIKQVLRKPLPGNNGILLGLDNPRRVRRGYLEHLISKMKDGEILGAHAFYTPEISSILKQNGMQVVSIVRDPRDVAVSYMHYLKGLRRYMHKDYMSLPDDDARLLFSICGGKLGRHNFLSVGEQCRQLLEWEKEGESLVIRFEDLIGAAGGGSPDVQRQTIEQVSKHLNLDVSEHKISGVQEELFGSTGTFRKGQIGEWEVEFSETHKNAAKKVAGRLLIDLGYEKDQLW